jgi:hypothetical protein
MTKETCEADLSYDIRYSLFGILRFITAWLFPATIWGCLLITVHCLQPYHAPFFKNLNNPFQEHVTKPSRMAMFVLCVVVRVMWIIMGVRMIMHGLTMTMDVRMYDDFPCAAARAAVLRAHLSRTSTFRTFHILFFACH